MSAMPPSSRTLKSVSTAAAAEAASTVHPWPEIDWIRPETPVVVPPNGGWYQAMKPSFDFLMSLVIAVPAVPVIGICWAVVKISSRGPGFYSQTRSGLNGAPYRILKLRTMGHNVEAKTGIQWSQKGDARVTGFGKFLRTTHLDELPQLFNVLRGEMSLVGPRPERPEVIQAKGLGKQVAGYDHRLDVRPGVTGFAQIQLPPDSNICSVKHKVAYDLYYIANQSLWFDLRLLAATALKTIGLKPSMLRSLLVLPRRTRVGNVFRSMMPSIAPPEADGQAEFQTA